MKAIPLFICTLAMLCHGCQDDQLGNETSTDKTYKVNSFLESRMKDIYYWAEAISDKQPDKTLDPKVYFNALKHEKDKWSYVSNENDETNTNKQFALHDGYDHGFGYNVTFWTVNNNTNAIQVKINFVYPGSPAAEAGLEKGDIITKLNGKNITSNTQTEILNGSTITLQINKSSGTNITCTLTSRRFDIDPILLDTIFVASNGKRVGYLCYTNFTSTTSAGNAQWESDPYLKKMTETFQKFKSEGVDEFILDLRHNTGGYSTAAVQLASLLCPLEVARGAKTLIKEQWNEKYNASRQTLLTFYKAIPGNANLNLSRLFVLTSSSTASASEVVISGLKPYLDKLTVIGQTTVGKNMGGQTFIPTDSDIAHWKTYLVTFTYTNSQDESIANGITPDISIKTKDNYNDRTPLGSSKDPYIATALQQISGVTSILSASKSTASETYTPVELPRPALFIRNE